MSKHWQEEEFIPYLDGRVSQAERTQLEEHLAACTVCRAQLEDLRAVLGVLGEWKAVEPSPGFDAVLRTRLSHERVPRLGWLGLRPAYLVALALAVLAVVSIALWQSAPPETPPPPRVAQTAPPRPVAPPPAITPPPSPPTSEDDLAVLDTPVLMDDYELLEQFDILFEPLPKEEKKL